MKHVPWGGDVPEVSDDLQAASARAGPREVFISYASPDRATAHDLCVAMETAGVTCWIAPRNINPGEFYADAIVHAIDAVKVMVLVLSQHTAESPHVTREVERATSKRCAIVSFRVDQFAMPPALEYFLNASHWLDASTAGVTATVPLLVDAVKRLLAPDAAPGDAWNKRRGGAAVGTNAIAVLPFANMSTDQDQEYFSDGLAEEIINLLAQIPGLRVIARTSAFAFRGKEQDIRGIADALGVTHVIEGSVRRAGNRLRITAQLIHAGDGTHLWSERYDRELSDIFSVQDEISTAIVGALRVKLSNEAAPRRYMPKIAAYEAYLKAKYFAAKVTPESLALAREWYQKASALDASFAMPHIGLGHCWVVGMTFGQHVARDAVPAARLDAQRALQIDPSLPEAHALLGLLAAIYELDWEVAERHFDFPLAKHAGFSAMRPMYGVFQFLRGNALLAIDLAQQAIEEDPFDIWPRMNMQAYLQAAGREKQALEQLKKVLELDPHQVVALSSMAMIYADAGDLAQALTTAQRAYAIAPWYPDTIAVLAALMQRNGAVAESQALAKTLGTGDAPGSAHAHALFHLLSGNLDQGADWTEKAIDERNTAMMFYLRFVVCRELRASPRWPKIAHSLNLVAS
jgi:TolB-like protein/Tfp pilus assembly protein PilF